MKAVIDKTCGRVCPLVKSLRDQAIVQEGLLNQLSGILDEKRAELKVAKALRDDLLQKNRVHGDELKKSRNKRKSLEYRNHILTGDLQKALDAKQNLERRIAKIRACCFEGVE